MRCVFQGSAATR